MKRIVKLCSAALMALLVLTAFCACGGSSYAGTWYNAYDLDGAPLILTKDGTFSQGGMGGTYTVDDGRIIFTASFMSDVLEIGKEDGKTCLIGGDREMWFKGEKAAQNYADARYEEESTHAIAQAKANGYFIGKYTNYDDYGYDYFTLTIKADNTYEYKYKKDITYTMGGGTKSADAWQKGTWTLVYKGPLGGGGVYLELEPIKSGGYDEFTSSSWIEENTLPLGLGNISISSANKGRLYSRDAVHNIWEKVE